jgi:hypothetical protein
MRTLAIRVLSFAKGTLLIGAITFALAETALQVLINTNTLKLNGVLERPNISQEYFKNYLKKRDPQLGWPSELAHGQLFNSEGYRPSPEAAKHKTKEPCVAVFGDSQGYGLDVSDAEAWTNVLAKKLNCKVENYSVPAYGTDQAYLRFRKVSPRADTVILTFINDNLRRNLLQYWDLALGPIYIERTKPRFITEANGALRLIPLPVNSYDQAEALNSWNFGSLFQHETFAPGSPIYRTAFQPFFPYTFSLVKAAISSLATRNPEAIWVKHGPLARLVDRRINQGESIANPKTISLQKAILQEFIKTCKNLDKNCLIVSLQPAFADPKLEATSFTRLAFESDPRIGAHIISGQFLAQCMHVNLLRQGLDKSSLDRRMPGGHYGPETNKAIGECLAFELSAHRLNAKKIYGIER